MKINTDVLLFNTVESAQELATSATTEMVKSPEVSPEGPKGGPFGE